MDLRFADDMLLFATSSDGAARMVDALVTCLKGVGLALSASKAKLANEKLTWTSLCGLPQKPSMRTLLLCDKNVSLNSRVIFWSWSTQIVQIRSSET